MKTLIIMMIANLLCGCSSDNEVRTPTNPPEIEHPNPPQTSNQMIITVGNATFTATLFANAATTEFKAMLPMTLNMRDFNNNEKVYSLPVSLTTSTSYPGTIRTGDIMLYGSNSLVLFYETFSTSYTYTKIGRINNTSGLKMALGSDSVPIKFELNGD